MATYVAPIAPTTLSATPVFQAIFLDFPLALELWSEEALRCQLHSVS